MFIKKDVADTRINSDENLINLVMGYSAPKERETDFPIAPEVVADDEEIEPPVSNASPVIGLVKPHHPGRPINGKEVPMELRVASGLLAQFDTIKNIAKALDLDDATVAQAKHGRSTFGQPNEELRQKLDQDLSTVRDKALDRLLSSLDLLTDEKVSKCSAKDISAISGNMAKVLSTTLPKDVENVSRAQLIVYAPTQINENRYERVEI